MAVTPFDLSGDFTMEEFNQRIEEVNEGYFDKNQTLTPATAAQYGDANATPDDVFRDIISRYGLYVPQTRTINGKALSADIVLDADDVGAARVVAGTYEGAGNAGANRKNSLTFDFPPKVVHICGTSSGDYKHSSWGLFVRGTDFALVCANGGSWDTSDGGWNGIVIHANNVTWGANTITWWHTFNPSSTNSSPQMQLNKKDVTYAYVAIG